MGIDAAYIDQLATQLGIAVKGVATREDLEALRRHWIGKDGVLKNIFRDLRSIDAADRPAIAEKINTLKDTLDVFLLEKEREFTAQKLSASFEAEYLDLSLPSSSAGLGVLHPITRVERQFAQIIRRFGFRCIPGPEIESEYFCFDSLNIPKHHPARDMQDTFFTDTGHVLRTHTSSLWGHEFKKGGLPIKVASYGRVYRNEAEDASHQAMFHQFDLVWLQEGLTLSHLMGLINHILKSLYGIKTKVRFVPKFYPYTEPSIGPQIDCAACKGKGCPLCGGSGWLTIAGAGMVHRNVLKEFDFDPDKVSGIAFGMGTSRLAAQFFGFPDLRTLYANDLRILNEVG